MLDIALGSLGLLCAIISMRWAMELGFSQFGQMLWGLAALFAGPLVMLILYIRLIRVAPASARRWF